MPVAQLAFFKAGNPHSGSPIVNFAGDWQFSVLFGDDDRVIEETDRATDG